jgi:CheY-like chemotaxis protein
MDDDELVCRTAQLMLTRLGYEVALSADGQQAIQVYIEARETDNPVAAAILDLKISGGMGAVETAQCLLDLDPDARLVVASGSTNVPEMTHYLDYGFSGCLAKPFLVADVGMVLGELLD